MVEAVGNQRERSQEEGDPRVQSQERGWLMPYPSVPSEFLCSHPELRIVVTRGALTGRLHSSLGSVQGKRGPKTLAPVESLVTLLPSTSIQIEKAENVMPTSLSLRQLS